jgi:predicted MFS family arabinose efflux permease
MAGIDHRTAAVAVAGICTFLNLYTPQAILPVLTDSFGVSPARTGLTITAPLLAVALIAPFVGSVSDRLGRKRLIVGACLILVLPTLLVAGSMSLEAMLVWRFLQGLLLPFIFAITVAYIGDECEGADGIRAAGIYSIGAILGGFGGRFIAGVVSDLANWRIAFMAIAALTLAGGLYIAWALPREQRFRPVQGGLRSTLATYRDHLANPRLLATCAIGFGMLFSNVATFTFVNFHLAAPPYSLSPAALGFVFLVYLLGVVTTTVATHLAVRIGRLWTLALAIGMACGGLLLTLLPSIAWAIAGLAGLSGGLFVVQALCIGYIGVAVRRAKSTAVGVYVTLYYIGGALGGILPGWVFHTVGWPGVVGLIIAVESATLVIAVLAWREPPAAA